MMIRAGLRSEFFITAYQAAKVAMSVCGSGEVTFCEGLTWNAVVEKIVEKLQDETTASVTAAIQFGYAYDLIGEILGNPLVVKLDEAQTAKLKSFVEKAADVFLFASDSDEGIFSPSKTRSGVAANAIVLQGLYSLANLPAPFSGLFGIPSLNILAWRDYFLTVQRGTDSTLTTPEDAYSVALGLSLLSRFPLGQPIVIQSGTTQFRTPLEADAGLEIFFTNTLAAPVAIEYITRVSATVLTSDETEVIASNIDLLSHENVFVLPLATGFKKSSKSGVYVVRISVDFVATSKYLSDSFSLLLKLSTSAPKGKAASISVSSDSKGKKSVSASFPDSAAEMLSADGTNHLLVSFSLQGSSKPHQAFIQLAYVGNNADVLIKDVTLLSNTFVPKFKDGEYSANIELGAAQNVLKLTSPGKYAVSVLIGDVSYSQTTKWIIGYIDLNLADVLAVLRPDAATTTIRKPAPPAPPLYEAAKPEITHVFRGDDVRPPKFLSSAFAIISALPFAILVLYLLAVGSTRVSIFGAGFLIAFYKLIFLGSILGMLLVVVAYWIFLPIVSTSFYLGILAITGLFFGHKAMA